MPDRDYYLRTDESSPRSARRTPTYIARLFTLANQPDPAGAAARILALETALAQKQWDRARNRDRNATYNKMTRRTRSRRRRRTSTGRRTSRGDCRPRAQRSVKDVIVRQPDYLKAVDAALAATPLATWKEYLTFGLISAYADDLPRRVRRTRSSSSTAR